MRYIFIAPWFLPLLGIGFILAGIGMVIIGIEFLGMGMGWFK